MTAGIRSVAAVLAAVLAAAGLLGAGPAAPISRVRTFETRAVLTLQGQVQVTGGHHVTTTPVDDGFGETRRVTVLAAVAGVPTRVSVTYDEIHRSIVAPGVPPEAAGRTFVVARGDRAHPAGQVTEADKPAKPYLAAEIAHDLRDVFVADPFVAAADTLGARPGTKLTLDPGVIERLLDLGAHTRVTKATLTLRRALAGRALLHLVARLATRVGARRVTGTLAGPVVVDTAARHLSWLRLEGDLAGRGPVTLDLEGGAKGQPPRHLRAQAAVKVKIRFSLSRSDR